MQTVGLTWEHSFEVAGALTVVGGVMAASSRKVVRNAGAFARETAVIGVLYGLWQLVGRLAIHDVAGAYARARWIDRVEHNLPLPSEHWTQQIVLGDKLLIQGANLYYAAMHMTTMLAFLIWLFVRHRDHYRPVRQVMASTTLGCLLIQMVPVAPPRMFPTIVKDTGLLYDQSVYSSGFAVDQLSAMPSVHVAWAVLIGWYVWRVSPSRWRWIGPVHAALMCWIVVITGNHWWLDGIVAVLVLAICAWGVLGVRLAWRIARERLAVPNEVAEAQLPVLSAK